MKIIRLTDLEWVPAGHEDRRSVGVWKKVLLQKPDLTGGQVQMVNWCKLKVGKGFQPHYHEDMEEIFVILKGQAALRVADEKAKMQPGDAVVIPPLFVHEMRNVGKEEAEYLAIGISQGKGGKTVVTSQPRLS